MSKRDKVELKIINCYPFCFTNLYQRLLLVGLKAYISQPTWLMDGSHFRHTSPMIH
jgi:hypothetical protein